MPGLREQRQKGDFCDVFLQATDGPELVAHKFAMSARFSGFHRLVDLLKRELYPKGLGLPDVRVYLTDINSSMLELLVRLGYHTAPGELVRPANIEVLDLNDKLQIGELREQCAEVLRRLIQQPSCVMAFQTATKLRLQRRGRGSLQLHRPTL